MGNFIFKEAGIKGVYVIDIEVYGDQRGYFMETYQKEAFAAAGLEYAFIQDNQSGSCRGVLRGLHFQRKYPQAKLVRVLRGEVYDVAVDLRKGSATYGEWVGTLLSGENRKQLLIPRGFAHGFAVLSDYAEFSYKCDEFYHPEDEDGIIWNDPDIGIDWPVTDGVLLSEKDRLLPMFRERHVEL